MKVLFALVLLLAALELRAQNYSVDWHKITGGGGTSTGGTYSVSGVIGQSDAGGAMSGGPVTGTNYYSVTGGFWSLISVVQTAGAPTLFMSHSGSTVTVYWQNVTGWNLQQNGNLAITNGWSASTGISTNGGTNYLNLTSPTGNLFFRLKNP